jgi:site-specific recombinase XerD
MPLPPELESLLSKRASSIPPGSLFFARIVFFNNRTRHFAMKTTAKMLLQRHCDKPFGALAGRHFFATHCAKKGMKIDQLQLLLGHAAVKNTARYLDLRDEEVLTSFNSIQAPTE